MSFIGMEKRLIWFSFEESLTVNSHGIKLFQNHPIGMEFNPDLNETYICTRSDIRCLNTFTGKILRIIAIQEDENEKELEINYFQLSVDKRHFLIGKSSGSLTYYSVKDGKIFKQIYGHKKEVSGMLTDWKNNLIISSGWDSKILIQKAVERTKVFRTQKKSHFAYPISILKLSVVTNFIAT
jgi:WD40 repeat protein